MQASSSKCPPALLQMQPHLWIFFHPILDDFLPILELQINRICILVHMTSFTQHNVCEIYPNCYLFVSFYYWVVFYYLFISTLSAVWCVCIYPMTTATKKQNIPIRPPQSPLSRPGLEALLVCLFITIVWTFLEFHIDENIHCIVFCVCFYWP